jgi:membrane protease YdiL (CAAX protease family)
MMHGPRAVGIHLVTMKRATRTWVGLLLVLASFVGALWITRSLSFRDEVRQSAVAAFATRPMRTVPLGRVELPTPGTIRVVLCPPDRAPAIAEGGSSLVIDGEGGRRIASEPLTRDESRGRRCLEAIAHASGTVSVRAELSPAASTQVATVERFTHRRITVALAWPALAFVLGLVLVLFGSRRDGDEETENSVTDDGFAPAVPPVQWPFSWGLAILAYIGVHIANAMLAVGWNALYKPPPGTIDGLTIAVTTLGQHGLLVLVSLALLGVIGSGRAPEGWRARMGFGPVTAKSALVSLGLAAALVGVAIAATKWIPDLNATPMGRILERAPARYAIAFGALVAPLSEELFFRGVLVSAFGKKSVWRGVVLSVLLFTGAHVAQLWGAWAGLVPIFAVGLTNSVLRAKTGGLSHPWLVHTLYNGALTASLYFV